MNLFSIALKNLSRRKSKIAMVMIGMIIGITTIVALSAITDAMNLDLGDRFDQIGANIVIVPKSDNLSLSYGGISVSGVSVDSGQLDNSVPEKIMRIPNKENISAIAPKLITGTQVEGVSSLIVGVDFVPELSLKSWWNIRTVEKPEGTNPPVEEDENKRPVRKAVPQLEDNQIILGTRAAEALGKKPGDLVTIQGESFEVWGVIDLVGSTVDDSIHMDLSKVQTLFNLENQLSFVEVAALCTTCPIDDIIMQIGWEIPDVQISAVREAVKAREDSVERFNDFAKGVAYIVLAIGSVVVMLTMITAVNERTREIGILRAIGFRHSHITTIILIEGIITSLLAGILGYVLGMVVANLVGPIIAQSKVQISWSWDYGVEALGIALLVGLVASILPAWKASKMDPAEALRYI